MKVDDYLALPFSTIVVRSATTHGHVCYLALHPELSGCMGQGSTPEEARLDLKEAARLYIEDMLASGEDVPTPRVPAIVTWPSQSEGAVEVIRLDADSEQSRTVGKTAAVEFAPLPRELVAA